MLLISNCRVDVLLSLTLTLPIPQKSKKSFYFTGATVTHKIKQSTEKEKNTFLYEAGWELLPQIHF